MQTKILNSNTFKCRKIVLMLEPVCDDHYHDQSMNNVQHVERNERCSP